MGRARLTSALDAAEDYAIVSGAKGMRDKKEPGRGKKMRAEARLQSIVERHFRAQKKRLREWMSLNPPTKATKATLPMSLDDALEYDDAFESELFRAMIDFTHDGISLATQTLGIGIDYTAVNTEAAKWSRKYVGKLIKRIDKSTRQSVRETIAAFVETPGMTMGDVFKRLPFDSSRAQMVGTTEVTRAYAEAELAVARELRRENPGVRVTVTWYTNNDDIVCDGCGPLNEKEVDEGEAFAEDADGEPVYAPPLHPGCRCWPSARTRING